MGSMFIYVVALWALFVCWLLVFLCCGCGAGEHLFHNRGSNNVGLGILSYPCDALARIDGMVEGVTNSPKSLQTFW